MAEDPRKAAEARLRERAARLAPDNQPSGAADEARKAAEARLQERAASLGKQQGEKPKSLFGQFAGMVGNLPSGLGGMVVAAARETSHLPGMPRPMEQPKAGEAVGDYVRRTHPFTAPAAVSMQHTPGHVVQAVQSVAPGGQKPSETYYGKASKEGRIVPAVFEDLGNAAIVAGGVSKGLGMAAGAAGAEEGSALARAAAAAHKVSHAANEAAAAPARVWTEPVRLAGKAVKASGVVPKIAGTELGQQVAARTNEFLKTQGWTPEQVAERRQVREGILLPGVQEAQMLGKQHELLSKRAEKLLGDRDMQYANHLVRSGFEPQVRTALDLTGEQRAKFIRDVWGIEQAPSERALIAARAYLDGKLPTAERAAWDEAWDATSRMGQQHEQMMLAGDGLAGGPMNPEQVGDVPMQSAIDRQLATRRAAAEDLRQQIEGDQSNPGYRQAALAARAAVPEVNLAEQVSQRAVERTRRAGALAGRSDLAGTLAERYRAARATNVEQEALYRDLAAGRTPPEKITAPVERAVRRTDQFAARGQQAGARADQARGRVFAQGAVERGAAGDHGIIRRPEDITPQVAADELGAFDQELRAKAATAAQNARDHLPVAELGTRPPRRFAQGGGHEMRMGGEWDWFDQLSQAEQRRMRRWMRQGGPAPDQVHQQYAGSAIENGQTLEGSMADFVRRTGEIDALERIAGGRGVPADIERAGHLLEGIDAEQAAAAMGQARVTGRRPAMADRVGKYGEWLRQQAENDVRGPEPVPARFGPNPWEMPLYDYSRELGDLTGKVNAAVERLDALGDQWADHTPEEWAAIRRLAELAPDAFDDPRLTIEELHGRLVRSAVEHGLEVPSDLAQAYEDPRVTAGRSAVGEANQEAIDAFQADREIRAQLGADLTGEDLAYRHLSRDQQAIYRQIAADARTGGAEAALAKARERAVGKAQAEGARRGEQVGRRAGAARVFGQEAKRLEGAAGAADRALVGTEATPAGADARAQAAMEQSMARPVKAGIRAGRAEERARIAERTLRSKENRLRWLEDRTAQEEARLSEGPQNVAPGKYRPTLLASSRAKQSLTEMAADLAAATGDETAGYLLYQAAVDLPATMDELHARGVSPEYLIGGVDKPIGTAAAPGGNRETVGHVGKLTGERQKAIGNIPTTTRSAGNKYVREVRAVVRNKTAERVASEIAVNARTYVEGLRDALPEGDAGRAGFGHLLEQSVHSPHDLGKWMERQGYTGWDPKNPNGRVASSSITPDTLFLPTGIYREFRTTFGEQSSHWATRLLIDNPTRGFKHMVLALNPGWQVGNMAGNSLLAMIGAGMSPAEMVRYGSMAKRLLDEEKLTGEVHFPPRLYNAGMGAEQLHYFADNGIEPRTAFGRTIQRSYEFNGFIDDWGRSAVYLAKKAKGYTDEQAVREALKAMGDFGRMTPFERNVVRRAIPFYAWSRHITQLAWHLALEHPFRVAWTLHLADLYKPDMPAGAPGFLDGAIPLGGDRYLPLGLLNPYRDVAALPLMNPKELARGLNPIIKAGASLVGVNLGKGRVFTRPPGTGPLDAYGNPTLGPIKARQFAYWLTQQTPATRAIFNATHDPVVRYDTGEPIKAGGRVFPLEGGGKAVQTIRPFVPLMPETVDTSGIAKRREQRLKQAERSRRRYFGR